MKPQLVPDSPKAPDMDALLAALQEAMTVTPGSGDPGYTTEELIERLKWSRNRVNKHLLQLHRAGRLVSGRRTATARDGRMYGAVVYRVIGDEK